MNTSTKINLIKYVHQLVLLMDVIQENQKQCFNELEYEQISNNIQLLNNQAVHALTNLLYADLSSLSHSSQDRAPMQSPLLVEAEPVELTNHLSIQQIVENICNLDNKRKHEEDFESNPESNIKLIPGSPAESSTGSISESEKSIELTSNPNKLKRLSDDLSISYISIKNTTVLDYLPITIKNIDKFTNIKFYYLIHPNGEKVLYKIFKRSSFHYLSEDGKFYEFDKNNELQHAFYDGKYQYWEKN